MTSSLHDWIKPPWPTGPRTWCWLPCWATKISTPCSAARRPRATGRRGQGRGGAATRRAVPAVGRSRRLPRHRPEGGAATAARSGPDCRCGPQRVRQVEPRRSRGARPDERQQALVRSHAGVARRLANLHTAGESRIGVELTADGEAGVFASRASGRKAPAWIVPGPACSRPVRPGDR